MEFIYEQFVKLYILAALAELNHLMIDDVEITIGKLGLNLATMLG